MFTILPITFTKTMIFVWELCEAYVVYYYILLTSQSPANSLSCGQCNPIFHSSSLARVLYDHKPISSQGDLATMFFLPSESGRPHYVFFLPRWVWPYQISGCFSFTRHTTICLPFLLCFREAQDLFCVSICLELLLCWFSPRGRMNRQGA